MTVKIALPPIFSERIGGRGAVDLTAPTVRAALVQLGESYPELNSLLWRSGDVVSPFLVVFVNDQDIQSHDGLDTPLHDGDEIVVVTALEGG